MEGEWLVCQGSGLPLRGTSNWRNREASQSSTKTSAKPCICEKITQCLSAGWERTGWAVALQKDLGVLVEKSFNGSQQCSLVATKVNCMLGCIRNSLKSRGGGKWVFPLLLGICGAPSVILCPALLPPKSRDINKLGKVQLLRWLVEESGGRIRGVP